MTQPREPAAPAAPRNRGRAVRSALAAVLLLVGLAPPAWADGVIEGLPHYDLDIVLDTRRLLVRVSEEVTWINHGACPVHEIVFNAHAAYAVPDKDIGFLAKMLEILRVSPKEGLSTDGPALRVEDASLRSMAGKVVREQPVPGGASRDGKAIPFYYQADNQTALVLPLPEPLEPGQSVTVRLNFVVQVPPKKGRWGQWDGITVLAQWLPVVAVHDGTKWDPTPFIPWHQPFFNEAGLYTVRVTLPCEQKLAASSAEKAVHDLGDGWRAIEFEPAVLRDFALVASARFHEWCDEADGIKVRCLALPEHEFYARAILESACKGITAYNEWFGRYPYPQFTVVEGCLGWVGNECGGLVIIDDRMFRMPHVGRPYPTYLILHELCHQWWYNLIGTNGYCETFMDEGPATYFSHRLADRLAGANNTLLEYPKVLAWAPNIRRDDFRNFSYLGARRRGDIHPTVQPLEKFEHLVNVTAATYDRGSKVIGMIEERLGEREFMRFMRQLYCKYQYRILRVRDFQAELEAFTGHPWEDFFRHWIYGSGMCDWAVDRVEIDDHPAWRHALLQRSRHGEPVKVVAYLRQQGGFNEPTVLGVRLRGGDGYQVRVPIYPDVPLLELDELQTRIECQVCGCKPGEQRAMVRVEMTLPCVPEQITVDPDHLLLDDCPTNNCWKPHVRWRLTPLYTQLEETDLTNAYDRWNIIAGPWVFLSSYSDPWFTRNALLGGRIGLYRTQEFYGGAYIGYRGDDRNVVAGVDALWDHLPLPHTQVGFTAEKSLFTLGPQQISAERGVVYGRYVFMYGDSLYLPPFHYVETFAMWQNRGLPTPRYTLPGADPFDNRPGLGTHYHLNLLTPYWDAEGGLALDATYQYGPPVLGNNRSFQEVYGQFSFVKGMPKVFDWLGSGPLTRWLYDTRWAFRIGGAGGVPSNGQLFSLGGGDRFRGFDLAERQGSSVWVGSVEWRIPIMRNLDWDCIDHAAGLRNVYLAPFYDVGGAYLEGQQFGPVAHALGAGLRLDVVWLGLIERTTLRLDFAKTLNVSSPVQIWFGVQHPF